MMDTDVYEELKLQSAAITRITFSISTEIDQEKLSVMQIDAPNKVADPKLGNPNYSGECSTCGAKKGSKGCDGHFGFIKFPFTIIHPYYLIEVAHILNKICPGCKSVRKKLLSKSANLLKDWPNLCRYCRGSSKQWYPRMKFKVSSHDIFKRTTIVVEVDENLLKKSRSKTAVKVLPPDYWDFIPADEQQEVSTKTNKRVLTHAQVRDLLNEVDPNCIKQIVKNMENLFLNSIPITPNCQRMAVMHGSNAERIVFDERTRAYKKLVDFRGVANELSFRLQDCFKISKLNPDKSLNNDSVTAILKKSQDPSFDPSGLRWVKDVVLAKRNDQSFRMVVVGDPNIKLGEVGIPRYIAEKLQVPEHLNALNWERLHAFAELGCRGKEAVYVRQKGNPGRLGRRVKTKDLQIGDIIYRPLMDGDIVMINRPPSIHQHSLIALSAKILPVTSVLCINPLICSPFRGDFDGDCLHGYVPQSVETSAELTQLVALDKQLVNRQSGRNLLSLGHDSLAAAHLLLEYGTLLDLFHIQQLEMFFPHRLVHPALIRAPTFNGSRWTGKQLFSMLLPESFNYASPSNSVFIAKGQIISCEGSTWLRETDSNFLQSLIKKFPGNVLDFLFSAQDILCEWLFTTGLSVSLSDLYLGSDPSSRNNLINEISAGLHEAEQICNFKLLMVDSNPDLSVGYYEEDESVENFDAEYLCYEKQRSAVLSQVSVNAFKQGFRDIQNLVYKYASKTNSLLAMCKGGSRGTLYKLVQNSMCLGLQYSAVPLSFEFPLRLSCADWNKQKVLSLIPKANSIRVSSYIPYAVVKNSFLTGLNPSEAFVHSVSSRGSSFSDHADLPGTLTRRLMFFMRDLHAAYDGTVRNAYGNQIIQFSYNSGEGSSLAGEPMGALAACAISEAAYSALDQPVSLLESSPLLNLKNVVECGSRKNPRQQSLSLFFSDKLGKHRHGFEYGALAVKEHLEKLMFSDIVSVVRIMFSSHSDDKMNFSPWVCHFHVSKKILKNRRLKVHSIIDLLCKRCDFVTNLPNVGIASKDCDVDDKDTICITATIAENSNNTSIQLDKIRDYFIPFLLATVVKGFLEVKKVSILWNEQPKVPRLHQASSGELYLRVFMEGSSNKTILWSIIMDACLPIMDMIDWTRSHPDNIQSVCSILGIETGWKFFLTNLERATAEVGKAILPEHLVLVANCLSTTGEFVSLTSKGLTLQREHADVKSPFVKACFSNPGQCFIKAAKDEAGDDLQGSVDALAWGKCPSLGTGGKFDLIYSGKGCELSEPVDVYDLLGSTTKAAEPAVVNFKKFDSWKYDPDKCGVKMWCKPTSAVKDVNDIIRKLYSEEDIQKLSHTLSKTLFRYPINQRLNEKDKSVLMEALSFHPQKDNKLGAGVRDIMVSSHPKFPDSRCFFVERSDGTVEDFSYRKCITAAYEVVSPSRAKSYKSRWIKDDDKTASDSFAPKSSSG